MLKALFLDRDGTLITDKSYLSDPAGVELIPGAPGALRRARDLGYGLFLFTNQSGIGRGLFSADDAARVNARMEEALGLPSPVFDGICIAPEAPGQPVLYRKPSPRFILEVVSRRGLDPSQCWMVGDSASDIDAGLAAGIRAAAVRTGPGDPASLPAVAAGRVPVFDDLAAFVASLGAAGRGS
jgi:D-glycero-D-manno-heptose 1,7-bisphosphate phosphatase